MSARDRINANLQQLSWRIRSQTGTWGLGLLCVMTIHDDPTGAHVTTMVLILAAISAWSSYVGKQASRRVVCPSCQESLWRYISGSFLHRQFLPVKFRYCPSCGADFDTASNGAS